MINGLTHNKTKLKIKEDTFTAFVMAQLLYLPDDLVWKILKNSCSDRASLPEWVGEIEQFDFWPHWDSKGADNERYVEPDMFLRFKELDIIVEAKRFDKNQQYSEQWKNEILAYMNEYKEEKRNVILFAIGGIWEDETSEISIEEKTIPVLKFRWQNILNEVNRLHIKFESLKETINYTSGFSRTLYSIIKAFEMHGFFTGEWLETLPHYNIRTEDKITYWLSKSFYSGKKLQKLPIKYHISNNNEVLKKWSTKWLEII